MGDRDKNRTASVDREKPLSERVESVLAETRCLGGARTSPTRETDDLGEEREQTRRRAEETSRRSERAARRPFSRASTFTPWARRRDRRGDASLRPDGQDGGGRTGHRGGPGGAASVPELETEADEVIALATPGRFRAVGQSHQTFDQVPTEEAAAYLGGGRRLGTNLRPGVAVDSVGDVTGRRDDRALAARLEERQTRLDFRPHTPLGELPGFECGPEGRGVRLPNRPLVGSPEVAVGVLDVGRHHKILRIDRSGDETSRVILVDDGFDALAVADDRHAAPTAADDCRSLLDESPYLRGFEDRFRFG